MSGLVWLLAGLDTTIHNLKVVVKAPFRQVLRKKYAKQYNDDSLFETFTNDKRDIVIWSKHSSKMFIGSGLFTLHLINEYEKKGKRVKLVTTGSDHSVGNYFADEKDWTMTRIDLNNVKDHDELFSEFVEKDRDILSLNTGIGIRQKMTDESFYHNMFERLSQLPENKNTIYLTMLVHVDEKKFNAINSTEKKINIRYIHTKPDFEHWVTHLDEKNVNILVPRFADLSKSASNDRDLNMCMEKFQEVPDWVFKKEYWSYFHFIYNDNGKKGFHFMESIEKPDEEE